MPAWKLFDRAIRVVAAAGVIVSIAAHAQPAADASVEVWQVATKVDKLDATSTLQATATAIAEGTRFRLTAECHSAAIAIKFAGSGVKYKIDDDGEITVRSKIDNEDIVEKRWTAQVDYEAGILFGSVDNKNGFYNYYADNFSPGIKSNPQVKFGQAMAGVFGINSRDVLVNLYMTGQIVTLARAAELRVKLPLADRDSPVIAINPQSDTFRSFMSQCAAQVRREVEQKKAQTKKETSDAVAGGRVWQTLKSIGIPSEVCNSSFAGSALFLPPNTLVKVLQAGNDTTNSDWVFAILDERGMPKEDRDGDVIQCRYAAQIFARIFVHFSAGNQQHQILGDEAAAAKHIRAGDDQWNHMLTFCPTRPDPSICLDTHYRAIAEEYTKALASGAVPGNRVGDIRSKIGYVCDRYRPQTLRMATMQDGTQVCPIYKAR